MRHPVLRKSVIVLAGLIAATLAVELLFRAILATPLRWVLPLPPVALFGPDAATGYRHRPEVSGMWLTEARAFIRTSNLGLRDRDRTLAKESGPRAVLLGDSLIEALQVDQSETAAAVAERTLARERPGAEVVNLGLSGARPSVLVARLQTLGLELGPDIAIVVTRAVNLLSAAATDDHEYVAYRRGADGEFHLSYGFRDGWGYRFRTSTPGEIFYWLLDHSQVARIVNGRKNVGLWAEWAQPAAAAPATAAPATAGAACSTRALDEQFGLWIDAVPPEFRAILDAFVRDLAAIRRDRGLPIVVAIEGLEGARCPVADAKRTALTAAIHSKLAAAGLQYLDLDGQIRSAVGPEMAARLHGFGPHLGNGHLNVDGNRVYGQIFAAAIAAALRR